MNIFTANVSKHASISAYFYGNHKVCEQSTATFEIVYVIIKTYNVVECRMDKPTMLRLLPEIMSGPEIVYVINKTHNVVAFRIDKSPVL